MGGLAPVSDDRPAGENLELDPDFGALERAAQGKPEVQYGNTVEPAVPPDWKETASLADGLLQRTHDLRVMVHLATARLHLEGLPGFARVVTLIRHELDQDWAHVHPQLDPEDDNDPMQRANALLPLRDGARVLRPLRDLPLANSPRTGPVAWRDIAVLNGAIEAEPDREKMTEAMVSGAFRESDPARLAAMRDAVGTLQADVPAIAAAFDRESGPGNAPDFDPLTKLLRDIGRELVRFQAPAQAEAEPEAAATPSAPADAGAPASAAPARAFASIQAITALTKREDALHALDLAASYFRSQEPSSPLPLLIARAQRLAGMEFMDILRDLAPDGLSQVQLVAGSTSE